MDSWTIAILTTATGGAFALIGGWLGARWGKTTEHEQWLRDRKLEAYSRVINNFEHLQHVMLRHGRVSCEAQDAFFAVLSERNGGLLYLVMPQEVRRVHTNVFRAVRKQLDHADEQDERREEVDDAFTGAYAKLVTAMKNDLRSYSKNPG